MTKKELCIKEASTALRSALHIVNELDIPAMSWQELRTAATQADQAAAALHRLTGIVETEQEQKNAKS